MTAVTKTEIINSTAITTVGSQLQPVSLWTWENKHRLVEFDTIIDQSIEDSWNRVATALAAPEKDPTYWAGEMYKAMEDFKFSPAGRIASNAGVARKATMFNCFVMGDIPDDMSGIFDSLKEAALTMQMGGGIGYDFSTLRPKGSPVRGVGADASGPLSFMDVWDSMCRTMMAAGSRRGAMMAVMRDDHPDIEEFIAAKRIPGRLSMFNLSVLISDAFMTAVKNDEPWSLQFGGKVYKTIQARDLWETIMKSTYSYAEPGVIFVDRINKKNNLWYCENIHGTNPCAEQPLPPYGLCLLGSVNFARCISNAFENDAELSREVVAKTVRVAVRMLDNVFETSNYPLPRHKEEALSKRRIGLGVTGLANALMMVGLPYGSPEAVAKTDEWFALFRREAYLASIELAKEKGAFPLFDKEKFLAGENIASLDDDIRQLIAEHGIRNALITSIAPTGTISLVADNVSGGLEPPFALEYQRKILNKDQTKREVTVQDYAYRMFRQKFGADAPIPDHFVTAQDLTPAAHLAMQAVVQKYTDAAISKTINLPAEIDYEEFKGVYMTAYDTGCKGCTTYRPNDVTGSVLSVEPAPAAEKKEPGEAHEHIKSKFVERPEEIDGCTYKLKMSNMENAMYVTINNMMVDGKIRPWEIFINSKAMEFFPWVTALTRMTSAVFQRGDDVAFVPEEFQAVQDPSGGAWWKAPGTSKPKYYPSIVAAIGAIIEYHLIKLGTVSVEDAFEAAMLEVRYDEHPQPVAKPKAAKCPRCGNHSIIKSEGCEVCTECGHQKCS
ncbi:MAG: adenosylcobalamin-dependent ribonucleoside-diphosphate reductase [Desulfovibrio sp.]|uniref:adenosylcobalamin-dependent ribonucleoside-diphosphate reductase n=1 Tax=Desulfovibrio sp. TaxID=885 RepID=UPI00135F0BC2|nr:adenosylcobalamin-dependent ribonucleoside-diphosphate reductase [Desulfovibrio sp.]MTJ93954.1 adenosylcobalamin-dependent ribonucleoside-diphosphate reductase [Desulfovibrio sp.]